MSKPKNLHTMFVYGTLMKGYSNGAILLRDALFLGRATTKNKYTLRVRGIPYVNKDTPTTQIRGEVYQVDDEELLDLDSLEGHPTWYTREEITVTLDNGKALTAWIYFNPNKSAQISNTGDYRNPFKNEEKESPVEEKEEELQSIFPSNKE